MLCFILQYPSSSIKTISDQLLACYSAQVYDHLSGQILIKQWWYLRAEIKQCFAFFLYHSLCYLIQTPFGKFSFVAEKLISQIRNERTPSVDSMNMKWRKWHQSTRFTVTLDNYRKDRLKHWLMILWRGSFSWVWD